MPIQPRFARLVSALMIGSLFAAGTGYAVSASSASGSVGLDEARLDPSAIEQATLGGLLASAESMTGSRNVLVDVVDLRVSPSSLASVSLDGVGRMRVARGEWIPMRFTGSYDLLEADVLGLRVMPIASHARSGAAALDEAIVERVNGQVATRILAEFPDQPVEIAFVDLQPINDARGHVAFEGIGLVDFAEEGAAAVTFTALMDRASGLVVSMDYRLSDAGPQRAFDSKDAFTAR